MAVSGRRNGMVEDDENEEEGLFEVEAVVELDSDTPPHLRPLAEAAQVGDVNALRLERGANMETEDEDGAIPLHDACAGGFTEVVQLLINVASNSDSVKRMLDAVDVEGDTPLHHAARGEHVAVIRLLLASGATPTKANIYRKIPSELSDPESQARMIIVTAANAVTCR